VIELRASRQLTCVLTVVTTSSSENNVDEATWRDSRCRFAAFEQRTSKKAVLATPRVSSRDGSVVVTGNNSGGGGVAV